MNAVAHIDIPVFQANLRVLAAAVAPTPIMAMLKADAYGHGMRVLAGPAVAAGAGSLGVLEISAALRLRADGVTVPLFAWLHGSDADFAAAAAESVDVGISSRAELAAALAQDLPAPLRVHLKVDTGLHRNGASPEEWPALVLAAVAAERAGRVRIRGVWSHLADAGEEADTAALAEFTDAAATARRLGARPELRHLAASSAGLYLPAARFELVRFGIAAYGVSPFDDRSAADIGVVPVMTLTAPVVAVDRARAEATVAAGWGDGLHARAAGAASVLIRGRRRPIIRMDVDTLLVRAAADVAAGDEVVVFGAGREGEPTPADWANWAGTIGDEILTRVSTRVPRRYTRA